MNEFDDLVSLHGVIMAGRFGPDGRVAEHKSKGLLIENPVALELAHWFCSAATTMFTAMAAAIDGVSVTSGFANWLPTMGWTFRGGDYAIAVHGAQFAVVESAKIKSLDELAGRLRQLDS